LSNVPAGNNLTVQLIGNVTDPGGDNTWNGWSPPFTLIPNGNVNTGITMKYAPPGGGDKTPPGITDVTPKDNETNVVNSATIQVAFSEPMAVNTVIDNGSFVVLDNASIRVPGTFIPSSPPTGTSTFIFKPTAPLVSGTRYTVTIDNTFVTDMAENRMGGPYSFGFHTRFLGQWGIPSRIESANFTTGNGGGPFLDVTLTEQGDVFAVWEETIVGPIYIYGARYNGSKNQWETPKNLCPTTFNYAWSSRVAADNAGNAIAVWQQEYDRVYVSRYSAGDWTAPIPLDVNQGNGRQPLIAMDKSGNALVSYYSTDLSNNSGIFISSYTPAGGWILGSNRVTGGECSSVNNQNLGILPNGSYFIFYRCTNNNNIYAKNLLHNGEAQLIGSGSNTAVSIVNYKAVMSWDNTDGTWSKFFDGKTSGFWSGPIKISDKAGMSSVAMNENGNIVAVWGGGSDNVYASHSTFSGKSWTSPTNLSVTEPFGNGEVRLGMDKDGNAIAAWPEMTSGGKRIYVSKRYDSGTGTWDATKGNISKNSQDSSLSYPAFSMTDSGNAVAAWLLWEGNSIYPSVHANFWYK
jgi:hypothetical protein